MSYEEVKYSDGYFRRESRNEKREFHRESGPAQIHYNSDGSIRSEFFYINGKLHREDGPASIYYYPDGSIREEFFYFNDFKHREFGPAAIFYNPDGSIHLEAFYLNGRYLGEGKKVFWALWDRLTDDKRKNPELLKYLVRFL
jgi:antitoxin component YwqK of YwqJK toxin-antitoxin module